MYMLNVHKFAWYDEADEWSIKPYELINNTSNLPVLTHWTEIISWCLSFYVIAITH